MIFKINSYSLIILEFRIYVHCIVALLKFKILLLLLLLLLPSHYLVAKNTRNFMHKNNPD